MAAFIFLCDMGTEQECLDRNLFGTNPGESQRDFYSKIAVGDTLFLYNFELGLLRGPFVAATPCTLDIDKTAWKKSRRRFPWQVRVDSGKSFTKPLGADDLALLVPLSSAPIGLLPPVRLEDEQSQAILEAIAKANR